VQGWASVEASVFLFIFVVWLVIGSTGKICALAKSRGLYVSKKSNNRLLKDCEKSDLTIEGENAVLQGRRKRRNAYIEVV
jgi:hypothetical protein